MSSALTTTRRRARRRDCQPPETAPQLFPPDGVAIAASPDGIEPQAVGAVHEPVLACAVAVPGPARVEETEGATLEDLVLDAWEGVTVSATTADCFVCGGAMVPRWGAGPFPVAARCSDCGCSFE